MKVYLVVASDNALELERLYNMHSKMLRVRNKRHDTIVIDDEIEIHYVLTSSFERWCCGRTFTFLDDYLMGRDIFFHGNARISKEKLAELLRGELL